MNTPYIRNKDGNLEPCTWEDALVAVAGQLHATSSSDVAVVAGNFVDAETLVATKDLFNKMGCENLHTEEGFPNIGAGLVYPRWLIFCLLFSFKLHKVF